MVPRTVLLGSERKYWTLTLQVTGLSGTEQNCWTFTLPKLAWKLIYVILSTPTHFQLTSSHTCYKYSTWEENEEDYNEGVDNEEESYNQHDGAHSNTTNGLRWYTRLSLETERGISCQSTNLSCQSFQLAWVKTAFCDSNNTLNIRYCEGYALLYCGHSLFTYAAEN